MFYAIKECQFEYWYDVLDNFLHHCFPIFKVFIIFLFDFFDLSAYFVKLPACHCASLIHNLSYNTPLSRSGMKKKQGRC